MWMKATKKQSPGPSCHWLIGIPLLDDCNSQYIYIYIYVYFCKYIYFYIYIYIYIKGSIIPWIIIQPRFWTLPDFFRCPRHHRNTGMFNMIQHPNKAAVPRGHGSPEHRRSFWTSGQLWLQGRDTWWFIPRIVSGLVHPSYKWTLPPLIQFITRVVTELRFVGWATKYSCATHRWNGQMVTHGTPRIISTHGTPRVVHGIVMWFLHGISSYGGFHGHAGYPSWLDGKNVMEDPIVRNGWWLEVPP